MSVNYFAVFLAAIAGMIVGAIWYTALSKQWLAALDRAPPPSAKPGQPPVKALATSFVCLLIMAFVLAGLIAHIAGGAPTLRASLITAVVCWAGFVATTIATVNVYPGRKPMLSVIDSGHWLAVLLVQATAIWLNS